MWRKLWAEIRLLWPEIKRPESLILIAASLLILTHHTFFRRSEIRKSVLPLLGIDFERGAVGELYCYALWALASFAIYFVAPLLLIKLLHRRRLADFGLGLGDRRLALRIVGIFAAVMIPLTVLVGLLPDICNLAGWRAGAAALNVFAEYYPQVKWVNPALIHRPGIGVGQVVGRLLLVHALLLLYFIGWEFIFRGYMLFGLYERFGFPAVLIANLPFVVLHYSKPFPEAVGAVIAGIALCVLALKSRSFWPCVALHWLVAASMEWVVVLRSMA